MRGGKRRTETARGRGDPDDKMIINQIMLRFRPIAPRPVTVQSSVGVPPVKEKRVKRKYVRVKKKKNMMTEECNLTNLTMKMKDDYNEGLMCLNRTVMMPEFVRYPAWISFDLCGNRNRNRASVDLHEVDLATTVNSKEGEGKGKLIESWITIESVIGTCEEEREIWKDLETDSCPGFISKGYDEVEWVNMAYRRMVDPEPEGDGGGEVVVWLGVKVEKEVFEYWPAFSCRVSVVYVLLGKKKRMTSVPCDVWRMGCGGYYAWRLDVKAALSLGRLS